MSPEADAALRLLVAAVSGALLGLPTSARGRFGGLRTHALVAMGATLFCLIVERHSPEESGRLVAAIVTGVGFIGAATVIKRKGYVVGLSSAASIWLAAGVGCSAGLGEWSMSLLLAGLISGTDALLLVLRRRLYPHRRSSEGEPPRSGPAPRGTRPD